MTPPAVRFAPSPTGYLHVGNARAALVNWLYARAHGGSFLLRIDDTDPERSREAYADAIREDLAWFGLAWDRTLRQSDRFARYAEVFDRFVAAGLLYPAYETAEELALKRKLLLARRQPPRYDRAALRLTVDERAALEAEGRRPHWRFRLPDGALGWTDLVRGPVRFEAANLSDPILFTADRRPLYTLASVVDDLDTGITHVIRGEDHVDNTAVHLAIYAALGGDPAALAFAHLPLLVDAGGGGLSKRTGAQSLRDLRAAGIEPMAVASLLARLGTSAPIEAFADLGALVRDLDLARIGRAAARFDPAELERLNADLVHVMPYAAVSARLPGVDERLWLAVRGNLGRVEDALAWRDLADDGWRPPMAGEDAPFLAEAAGLMPPEPWDAATWNAWTGAVKQATGRKGGALFRPLRLALTGREHGPALADLLPIIGRTRARARLGAG